MPFHIVWSAALPKLLSQWFWWLTDRKKQILPCARGWKTMPENGRRRCLAFCLRSLCFWKDCGELQRKSLRQMKSFLLVVGKKCTLGSCLVLPWCDLFLWDDLGVVLSLLHVLGQLSQGLKAGATPHTFQDLFGLLMALAKPNVLS